jgi:GNAT superfamily N-acetyltransferase
VLVVERPAFGPITARLWVVDIFVHPDLHGQGLGKALLQRSLHHAGLSGHPLMGLVVTDGNPAQRLYESVGFTHVATGTNVDLPGR